MAVRRVMADESRSCSLHGFTATITRSAGTDQAVVVFIDGPDDEHEHESMPDGSPRVRIRLNDEPVYAPVPYEHPEEESDANQSEGP